MVPSRGAAGWRGATLGSEPHDLGLGTAFAVHLEVAWSWRRQTFWPPYPHSPFVLPSSVFPFWKWDTVRSSCPLHRKTSRDILWQLLPTCKWSRQDCQHQVAIAKGSELWMSQLWNVSRGLCPLLRQQDSHAINSLLMTSHRTELLSLQPRCGNLDQGGVPSRGPW